MSAHWEFARPRLAPPQTVHNLATALEELRRHDDVAYIAPHHLLGAPAVQSRCASIPVDDAPRWLGRYHRLIDRFEQPRMKAERVVGSALRSAITRNPGNPIVRKHADGELHQDLVAIRTHEGQLDWPVLTQQGIVLWRAGSSG